MTMDQDVLSGSTEAEECRVAAAVIIRVLADALMMCGPPLTKAIWRRSRRIGSREYSTTDFQEYRACVCTDRH
jgi:hypothetical protein